jgi:hypothetical protein
MTASSETMPSQQVAIAAEAAGKQGPARMATEKDVDHLHHDDRRQTGGGRLQVDRVEAVEQLAVVPTGSVEDEEEGKHGRRRFQHAEEQVGAGKQPP